MLLAIFVIFVLSVAGFGFLFRIMFVRSRSGAFDPLDWLEEFSAESYRTMERLLNEQDYVFLASQAGFEPSIARRLRRERVGIFQSYLRGMIRDFHRLLKVARFITVFASHDQSTFEAELWRLRWSFYGGVIAVEMHVALHWLGLGNVDARPLVAALQRAENCTQQLIPAAA